MYKAFLHSNQIYYEELIDEQEIGPPLWELVALGVRRQVLCICYMTNCVPGLVPARALSSLKIILIGPPSWPSG